MTVRTIETSPQLYARIGGLLYLIIIITGLAFFPAVALGPLVEHLKL